MSELEMRDLHAVLAAEEPRFLRVELNDTRLFDTHFTPSHARLTVAFIA